MPKPSATEAAAVTLTDAGVPLTIKQRDFAWLPGGQLRLHLDDITGRQVLISITDAEGAVVQGPQSLKVGEKLAVDSATPQAMLIECQRLKNLMVGEDFGEFVVRPKPKD